MAYDLEEQEQLATFKAWWKDNGTFVVGLILALAIAVSAWQGWRIWRANQAQQAGAQYETLFKALQAGNAKAVGDAAGTLVAEYPRTLYASMGALNTARFYFERADLKAAKAQLQWVVERSPSEEFRDVARLRLAAVLLDEKSYDAALGVLEQQHATPMEAAYAALRGDILVAKGKSAEAKVAYRAALEKADAKDAAFRANVQLRLDGLGG